MTIELFKELTIINAMRHIVLVLMIALLPLRGWAGDVMATHMASAATATATKIVAATAHKMAASASFYTTNQASKTNQTMPDCHEQMASQPNADQTANNDHCGTCQVCQVCHTVALSPSGFEVATSLMSDLLRPVSAAAFTSAAAALGQKPPIS